MAKPQKYFSQGRIIFSPYIINNEIDKEMFLHRCNPSDFFYQKYIQGESCYLLYYFHRNGGVLKFSQCNFIQQPNGKSIVAAVSSEAHDSSVSIKFEKLFKKLQFYGLVMIEIRKANNENFMIEANPRFWGPS